MAMCWIRPAVKATVQMAARKRPYVIWATAGPVSSFVVAQRASQRTGVPYVLDFRDAWTITYNEFEARRPAWATRLARRNLYRLLAGAQAVTFRYHTEAECYWRAYRGALEASRIHIIPNGYEGTIDEFVVPKGEKCTVLYAGTLSSYRYDTLLQALHGLKQSDAARARRLRLLVVGEGAEALADEATELGLSDIVESAGPTSQAAIARLQQEAHALLVLGRPPTMKGYELFAGAKLFGYLQAGRPIVGVLPPDETKKILHRVGVSTVADADSLSEIVAVFRQLLDAWAGGTLSALVPDRAACQAYSAERQTAALVCALEGKPAAEPFVPHAVEVPPSLWGDISDAAWAHACRQT
jgi:glycosyltransferase involved in cell wall biosynthesis